MNKKAIVLLAVLFLLLSLTVSFLSGLVIGNMFSETSRRLAITPSDPIENPADGLERLGEVLDEVAHSYVEKVDRDKLINGAIDGMIKALDDPYTRRLKPTDYGDFQEQTAGHFGGVGMELGMRDNKLTVVAPIKNTPAERAGVQAGDFIVKIDDKSTEGMPIEKAVKLIRGEEETKVTLTFRRNGGE